MSEGCVNLQKCVNLQGCVECNELLIANERILLSGLYCTSLEMHGRDENPFEPAAVC